MGLGKKTIDDENYAGKRVLVRCDFNVPMKDGVITNDNRINAALPTIKKLIADGAKVILCSHLGKPKNGPEAKFSLAPVAVRLSEKLGQPVTFADDDNVVGENAKAAVATMGNGEVVLLQNTRFRKEETKNEPAFSEELASLADAYVDDAFGSCHRAHCSTAGVTDYVKDTAVGYLMEKEIKYLGNAVNDPERPFTAILGGAKVADKLNQLPMTNKSARQFKRFFNSGAVKCETDAQGRVIIPQTLRTFANIEKDVVIIGNGEKAEIWNKEAWDEINNEESLNMDEIADKLDELDFRI